MYLKICEWERGCQASEQIKNYKEYIEIGIQG